MRNVIATTTDGSIQELDLAYLDDPETVDELLDILANRPRPFFLKVRSIRDDDAAVIFVNLEHVIEIRGYLE